MRDDLLDLGQLRTFLRVVDETSVVRAARSLDVSQPSVTQQIQRLERKLGRKLFRRGKTLDLTNDGQAMVVFARSLFAVADEVRSYFQGPDMSGTLRVGLNEDLARTALPQVLHLFALSHPNFHLHLRSSCNGQQLFEQLDEGQRDIVVARRVPGRAGGLAEWEQPLHWLGRRDHRGPVGNPVPLATPPSPSDTRDIMIRALTAAGLDWKIRFESENISGLEAAVKSGVGVCAGVVAMQSEGVAMLGADAGLPELSTVTYVLECRPDTDQIPALEAFMAILRNAIPMLLG